MALLDDRSGLDAALPLGRALAFWHGLDGANAADCDTSLQQLGLESLVQVPVRYLSTGQLRRAALARLLGQRARIWLLDEPLNGLDNQASSLTEALVAQHCEHGGVAVIASHQPFTVPGLTRLDLTDFTP